MPSQRSKCHPPSSAMGSDGTSRPCQSDSGTSHRSSEIAVAGLKPITPSQIEQLEAGQDEILGLLQVWFGPLVGKICHPGTQHANCVAESLEANRIEALITDTLAAIGGLFSPIVAQNRAKMDSAASTRQEHRARIFSRRSGWFAEDFQHRIGICIRGLWTPTQIRLLVAVPHRTLPCPGEALVNLIRGLAASSPGKGRKPIASWLNLHWDE